MLSPTATPKVPSYPAGVKLLNERNFEAALDEFKAIVSVDPEHAEAQYQIARIYMAANRPWRAIASILKAIEVKPEAKIFWQAYAEAVALGGSSDEEEELLNSFKNGAIDAKLKITLQDRFAVNRKSTKPAMGGMNKKQAKQILEAVSNHEFARVERMARKALTQFPRSAFAANILAVAQANLGHSNEARQSYARATKLDPKYAEAYDNLGNFLLSRGLINEATSNFKKAVILAPGMLSALVALGVELNKAKEYRAALVLLNRAVTEHPKDARAILELGNLFTRLSRHEEAEVQFEKARELAGNEIGPDHRVALAQAKSRNGKDDEALAHLDCVLSEFPDFPPALRAKATLFQTLGKFEESRELFDLVSSFEPNNGETYRMFVTSQKIAPDDTIIDEMRNIYAGELGDFDRMNIAFAISKALEDVKRDEEVFTYLNSANFLVRKSTPYLIQKRFNEVTSLQAAYAEFDFVGSHRRSASQVAPIFVTGMPRSGTTLVEQIIASHSTMESAGELGRASVLARDLVIRQNLIRNLDEASDDDFTQLGDDYEEYVSERFPDANRITDKAITTYMHIGPLKLAMPNAKFIVVRRDPRDNLFSIYKNKFPEGTHGYAYDMEDLARYYTTFVEMIDFWRERVPDWFYEVQYENLVANPEEESRKLIAACGLEWEDACLNFHQNKNKVQTLSLYQVRQPISKASVKGWKRFEKELEPILKILREDGHVSD